MQNGTPVRERWQKQRDGERKGQKMRGNEEQPGKEAMGLHSEKHACPRRGETEATVHEG
jgi:hypothetical protein